MRGSKREIKAVRKTVRKKGRDGERVSKRREREGWREIERERRGGI